MSKSLLFLFEGGDHLTEGIRKVTELAQRFPNSILGGYANAIIGLYWSEEFKDYKNNRLRAPNPEMANTFLKAAENNVKGYWADSTFLNLAEINRKEGEKESMKDVLGKYIDKFEDDSKNTNGIESAKKILNEQF